MPPIGIDEIQTSQDIMYSKGKNDENYTPRYAVTPLLKYIDSSKVIWCPFDTSSSEFVKVFTEKGFKVISSHIATGQDFYTYEPDEHWDIIITNGPFTNKRLIFERMLSFRKPFCNLMSLTWLNDAAPKQLFKDVDLELLMFDKRIKYTNPFGLTHDKITFSSAYYCVGVLPKQIIMESIKIKE